ncbi:MAG: hypothetical protein E7337_13020 [Clostridiales bacterium]|nr:hypothetical protein [Clostridiales bacterium]
MKRIISLIVSVFLLLSAFAFAENATSELQGMYAEAELLMAQGDYSGAASKFETLGAFRRFADGDVLQSHRGG